MESQKRSLDLSSSFSTCKRMKLVDDIASSNLDDSTQQEGPEVLSMGSRKRVADLFIFQQNSKRCKGIISGNLDCTNYCSVDDNFNIKDFGVPAQLFDLGELNMTTEDGSFSHSLNKNDLCETLQTAVPAHTRRLFQSMRVTGENFIPSTMSNESLIRSRDIDTCGTYQHGSRLDFCINAVNRLFHGVEAMASLDSIENSDNAIFPDVDQSQEEYERDIFWTTAQDEILNMTNYKTLEGTEEFLNSVLNKINESSVIASMEYDLDSYKCGSCNIEFQEFSKLMTHSCSCQTSGIKVLPLLGCMDTDFFTSTRKDLESYLPSIVQNTYNFM